MASDTVAVDTPSLSAMVRRVGLGKSGRSENVRNPVPRDPGEYGVWFRPLFLFKDQLVIGNGLDAGA